MRRAGSVLALVLIGLMPGTALAQDDGAREPQPQVVLSGDVLVRRGEVRGEIVVVRGSATVDGVVEGDVIVARGPITVAGQVTGDVVALSGRVRLRATAQVGGSVLAGDVVEAEAGAQVAGGVTQGVRYTLGPTVAALGALMAPIAMAVSVLVIGLLWLLLAPRSLEPIARSAREAPLPSLGWGLVVSVLVPIAGTALVATVLGLPVGIAVLLGAWALVLLGLTAATWSVGRLAVREPGRRIGAWFAGWGIGAAVGLVPFLNLAWWILGSVIGMGILVVTLWRARRGGVTTSRRGGRHRAGRPSPGTIPPDAADVPPAGLG